MKSTAKENINKLPECLFGVDRVTAELITMHAGENGFHQYNQEYARSLMFKHNILPNDTLETDYERFVDQVDRLADFLNSYLFNCHRGHRMAMEAGTMFAWDILGADADLYTEEGKFDVLLQDRSHRPEA